MRTTVLAVLLLSPCLALAAPLPPYLTLPAGMHPSGDLNEEVWGEAEFPVADEGEPPLRRGHHWSGDMTFDGLPEGIEDNDVWAKVKPALQKGGWTIVKEFDVNPYSATFRYQKGGKEAWGWVMIPSATDIRFQFVEVTPQPIKFSLKPPGKQPEKLQPESGNYPYLMPLPGSEPAGQSFDPKDAFLVKLDGKDEEQVVATGRYRKEYHLPGLSNVQFQTVYRDALKAAGWSILDDVQGPHASDAVLMAHYAANGRDLWTYLHHSGDDYSIDVADAGREDLAAKLAKDCRVPLYGVLFDFDKATLKPASDAVLGRARDALQANPRLSVEVQGHTDNVGGDDYNAKLSEARARSVMQWLVKNGVPAARLTSKGYGKSKPVADNDTPEGRAKNRRVELSCRK